MRLFSSLIVSVFLLAAILPQNPNKLIQPKADIFVIKGLAGTIFSSGLFPLADQLHKDGRNVDILAFWDTREAYKTIVNNRKTSVVLICHSLGCNAATGLAYKLKARSIRVCLLAAFDPAGDYKVHDNVDQMITWFQGNYKPLEPMPEFTGRLEQHKIRNVSHTAIAGMKTAHARIREIVNHGC